MVSKECIIDALQKHWIAALVPVVLILGFLLFPNSGEIIITRIIPALVGYTIINYFIQRERGDNTDVIKDER